MLLIICYFKTIEINHPVFRGAFWTVAVFGKTHYNLLFSCVPNSQMFKLWILAHAMLHSYSQMKPMLRMIGLYYNKLMINILEM